MISRKVLSLVGVALVLLGSCRKEEEMESPVTQTAVKEFTATFDMIPGQSAQENLIYITDASGNVLAHSTWTAGNTVRLTLPTPQQRFNVTVVRKQNNQSVRIATFMNVNRSSWIWMENPPKVSHLPGASIEFSSAPAVAATSEDATGDMLFSSSSYEVPVTRYAADARRLTVDIPAMSSGQGNALIVFPKLGKYKFIPELRSDKSYQVDLGEMGDLAKKNMAIPENQNYQGGSVSISYSTVYRGSTATDKSGMLDFQLTQMPNGVPASVPLQYAPLSLFGEFYTDVNLIDQSNRSWSMQMRGQGLPDRFSKINGDFKVMNSNPASVQVSASGEFDYLQLNWKGKTAENANVTWTVLMPREVSSFRLDRIPAVFGGLVPGFSFENLRPAGGMMVDYEKMYSYDDYINFLADPANWSAEKVTLSRSLYQPE